MQITATGRLSDKSRQFRHTPTRAKTGAKGGNKSIKLPKHHTYVAIVYSATRRRGHRVVQIGVTGRLSDKSRQFRHTTTRAETGAKDGNKSIKLPKITIIMPPLFILPHADEGTEWYRLGQLGDMPRREFTKRK
ncbi:MAG TPA: hypothetical protein DHU79_06520 [Clostridiales bacterium]|nr:hypothetical protein [Clostridiales bacterium]